MLQAIFLKWEDGGSRRRAGDWGNRLPYVINLCTVDEIKIYSFLTLSANSSGLN